MPKLLFDKTVHNHARSILNDKLKELLENDNSDLDGALKLVRLGADPNVKLENGRTFLYEVAFNITQAGFNSYETDIQRCINIATELVNLFGADINSKNGKNRTPLQKILPSVNDKSCCLSGALGFIRLGANPNDLNKDGDSLLHFLATNMHYVKDGKLAKEKISPEEIIKEITTLFHADINIKNAKGLTPLQCMINQPFRIEDALLLIKLGANPNVKNINGVTLLHVLLMKPDRADCRNLASELTEQFSAIDDCGLCEFEASPEHDKRNDSALAEALPAPMQTSTVASVSQISNLWNKLVAPVNIPANDVQLVSEATQSFKM